MSFDDFFISEKKKHIVACVLCTHCCLQVRTLNYSFFSHACCCWFTWKNYNVFVTVCSWSLLSCVKQYYTGVLRFLLSITAFSFHQSNSKFFRVSKQAIALYCNRYKYQELITIELIAFLKCLWIL